MTKLSDHVPLIMLVLISLISLQVVVIITSLCICCSVNGLNSKTHQAATLLVRNLDEVNQEISA